MIFAPIDIEDVLRTELSTESVPVFAPPIPDNLESRVPCARVRRTGGGKTSLVVDSSSVVIDTWAETDAEAMAIANDLAGALTQLQFTHPRITQVSFMALPYQNNDPSHPTLCRAAFMAQIYSTSERS